MKYSAQALRDFSTQVMKKNGLNEDNAEVFADSLVMSEMRGINSHGITRLKGYAIE